MAFSNAWGFRHMVVCNLFAFRATNPFDLIACEGEIRRDDNIRIIADMGRRCSVIVCAWGHVNKLMRGDDERQVLAALPLSTYCLGRTKDGAPRHPLYLAADTPLIPYGWQPK